MSQDDSEDEYEEVNATIRLPKGHRLADSKKNEGWSVGFTPRTSDQNPEFVGIKIKDEPGSSTESSLEWDPTYDHDFSHAHAQGSYPEDDELADISRVLVVTAIVIAVQVGKPFLRRFFEEKIVPFYLRAKNARAEGRNRREKGKNARIAEAKRPGTALAIQEANLTTDEAKMIFAQAMMAQHFANEKMRLLAAARIENPGQTQKLFEKFKKLSQPDVAKALTQLLVDNPNLLSELAAARAEGQLPSPQELRRLLEK